MPNNYQAKKPRRPQLNYIFSFRGTYRAIKDGVASERPYEISNVRMSQEMVDAGATHTWLAHLGPELLSRKYSDFASLVTYEIARSRTVCGTEITNPRIMSIQQLMEFISDNGFEEIDVTLYEDLGALQQAVMDFQEALRKDEVGAFVHNQDTLRKAKGGRISLRNKALLLNADWSEDEDSDEDFDIEKIEEPVEPDLEPDEDAKDEEEGEPDPQPVKAEKPKAKSAKERAAERRKAKKGSDKDVIAGL